MFLTQDNGFLCTGLGYKWFPNDKPAVNSRFALLVLLRSDTNTVSYYSEKCLFIPVSEI